MVEKFLNPWVLIQFFLCAIFGATVLILAITENPSALYAMLGTIFTMILVGLGWLMAHVDRWL